MSESKAAKLAMYLMSSPPGEQFCFCFFQKISSKYRKTSRRTGFNKACRNINAAKCVDGVFRDLVRT